MNSRCTTQLAKLSFDHSIGCTQAIVYGTPIRVTDVPDIGFAAKK